MNTWYLLPPLVIFYSKLASCMDEVQQATAKRRQNGSSVVHDGSATTSTPQRHTDDRRYSCFPDVIRPRPRNTYWRRSDDADSPSEHLQFRVVSPFCASCIKFVAQCYNLRSSCWWSLWWTRSILCIGLFAPAGQPLFALLRQLQLVRRRRGCRGGRSTCATGSRPRHISAITRSRTRSLVRPKVRASVLTRPTVAQHLSTTDAEHAPTLYVLNAAAITKQFAIEHLTADL